MSENENYLVLERSEEIRAALNIISLPAIEAVKVAKVVIAYGFDIVDFNPDDHIVGAGRLVGYVSTLGSDWKTISTCTLDDVRTQRLKLGLPRGDLATAQTVLNGEEAGCALIFRRERADGPEIRRPYHIWVFRCWEGTRLGDNARVRDWLLQASLLARISNFIKDCHQKEVIASRRSAAPVAATS